MLHKEMNAAGYSSPHFFIILHFVHCLPADGRRNAPVNVTNMKKYLLLLALAIGVSWTAHGQNNVAVKTNLLYDAAANVNLGFEFPLAPRWSFDLSGDYNQWTIREHKWKHWFAQPEFRYWFCERYVKHFVGVHGIGGQFNVGNLPNNIRFLGSNFSALTDYRYQGWGVGGGLAYGYALPLSQHWNMEFEIGAGYVYLEYDAFRCQGCGKNVGSGHHHYIGPTKAAVNLVYLF